MTLQIVYAHLDERFNDGKRSCLHYVSARELFNIVKAAEARECGDPNTYRDYLLPRPDLAASPPQERSGE